jgi:peptide/nickel transport system substrate-binding protein
MIAMRWQAGPLCLSALLLLSACGRPLHQVQPSAAVATVTAPTTFDATPALEYPDPGPYKTVEIKNADGSTVEAMQARGDVGKFGGTLRTSTFGTGMKTFNPWAAGDVESKGLAMLQFERLLDLDPWTGKPYTRLAKSLTISPDNRQYTFVLRKGLKWSDGKPLTADDVVFTFNTLVRNGYGQDSVSERDTLTVQGQFPKVEKLDDLTVRFTTKVPFAPFLTNLRSELIAPKHILEPVTKKPIDQFSTFWDVNMDPVTMVASGPFILSRVVPGQRVELKRNPNYFMVDKQGQRLPYLDQFTVAIVPDQNTQILKFYGDEIDMLDVRYVRGNDVARMKMRERNGDFSMHNLGPDDGTVFLMFNLNRRKDPKTNKFYVEPMKQEWFNNLKFRQAVNHAIDRTRIVDNMLKGVGIPLFTSESPASIYFDKDLKPFNEDLALSAKLLQEGGFVLKGDELYDPKGNRVEFTLTTNSGNSTRDGICVSIQNELKKLGIKVNYQPIDFNILLDKTSTSCNWEAIVMGLSGSKVEPYEGANVWKTFGRMHMFDQRLPDAKGDVSVTDARDWEKKIDNLFDQAATHLNPEERRKYWNQYQAIVYEQVPFIYIESPLDITAVRNTIANYKPTPLGVQYTPYGSLHNIEEIYFKTGQH